MSIIANYPKIYNLGHGAIATLLLDSVVVEEKLDGSQFSCMSKGGVFHAKSKSVAIYEESVPKLFKVAYDTMHALFKEGKLIEGYTYRGEAICTPRHNSITYSRIPAGGFIIYDIQPGLEQYLSYADKQMEAQRLGLEIVPCFFEGIVTSLEQLSEFMNRESVLGGAKIEGYVIKNYKRFAADGHALMGKHVSETFKELNSATWSQMPGKSVSEKLIERYVTPARWSKAVSHFRDAGKLTNSPKDIGELMKEVKNDLRGECELDIKQMLFQEFWDDLSRKAVQGFPGWYKEQLIASQPLGTVEVSHQTVDA